MKKKSKMENINTEPEYFLLKLEEYEGETSSLTCYPRSNPMQRYIFCLIGIRNDSVRIVDAGYTSAEELLFAHKELSILNPKQLSLDFELIGEPRYFILEIVSLAWKLCEIYAQADNANRMFCVLAVFDNGIDVLDWGYSSIEQLLDAWNDKKFENACMLTFFPREYS